MSHQVNNGVRVEERDRGNPWPSLPLSHFYCSQFWFGVRDEILEAYCWLLQLVLVGSWAAFLWFPPDLFKVLAWVVHS